MPGVNGRPWIVPDWPAPRWVGAASTTRNGGVSRGRYTSWNLGMRTDDDPAAVQRNRRLLALRLGLPSEPCWLRQVHGREVVEAPSGVAPAEADACVARRPGAVCVVLTADCLPVLLYDRKANVAAAVHAGWRGLAKGVLEATLHAMGGQAGDVIVWIGPCIGAQAYEVGGEVRTALLDTVPAAAAAFRRNQAGRWLADLRALARQALATSGVRAVYGAPRCTYRNEGRYFSYRRDQQTGRMATLIWLRGAHSTPRQCL